MNYRSEIDGLRTVAVLPVILFHAGFKVFSGGFVGVDIFFVISGFLITSILISEMENGDFSLLRFYERRARRILPALFFVMAVCAPIAWAWMLPKELADFARSQVMTVFFVSNVFFFKEVDYFGIAAELRPLLHTWSLAVEEQYYLLFPVFLLLLWRLGRDKLLWLIGLIAIVSFGASHWASDADPVANFYLAPTRAWELLAGSICAFLSVGKAPRTNESLSLFGFALILFAIFYFDKTTPFPSAYALAPVVGTALVILFGQGTLVGKALSTRPFVGIGLISFSAYLWHQPLFAFARLRSWSEPSPTLMFLLAVASLVLAYGSWRFVEQPFRKPKNGLVTRRSQVFGLSAAAGIVFVLAGAVVVTKEGNPWRYDPDRLASLENLTVQASKSSDCDALGWDSVRPDFCVLGVPDADLRVAVIGDSHAHQFSDVLDQIGNRQSIRVELFSKSACTVTDNSYFYPKLRRVYSQCEEWRNNVVDYLSQDTHDLVVLTDSTLGYLEVGVSADAYVTGLDRSLQRVAHKDLPVLYVQDNPRFSTFDASRCYTVHFLAGALQDVGQECSLSRQEALNPALRQAENRLADTSKGIFVADLSEFLCDQNVCFVGDEAGPWMSDSNHLTPMGAARLEPELERHILSALAFPARQ